MSDPKKWMPPFASGKLVSTYEPLYYYWKELKESGEEEFLEKSMLNEDDYRKVAELAQSSSNLYDILDALKEAFKERISPEYAVKALRRYGVNVDEDSAVEILAGLLASWAIEAAEKWGMIRLRER